MREVRHARKGEGEWSLCNAAFGSNLLTSDMWLVNCDKCNAILETQKPALQAAREELQTARAALFSKHELKPLLDILDTSKDPKPDVVAHPPHYTAGKVECIDAIEAATAHLGGVGGFLTGQVIKYVWRWKLKNGVQDLEKAKWYLERLIDRVKGGQS